MTWAWTDEDRAPDSKRLMAYRICQERGHKASGFMLASNPPWDTCKHCGTAFRYEQILQELESPEKPR